MPGRSPSIPGVRSKVEDGVCCWKCTVGSGRADETNQVTHSAILDHHHHDRQKNTPRVHHTRRHSALRVCVEYQQEAKDEAKMIARRNSEEGKVEGKASST
jgi:hypothetical protein